MMAKVGESTQVKVQFRLPEDTYDVFAERAAKYATSAEVEILKTLARCRDHNAITPIYFTDDQRNELSMLVGLGLRSPEDIIRWARNATTFKVAGIEVALPSQVITRLQARCFGSTFDELMKRVVVQALEEYVGLR